MKRSLLHCLIGCIFICFAFIACSGGESGTGLSSSRPVISVGVITGFGSVFVNGVEFLTDSSEINVNESEATEQDLSTGMVVAVVGYTNRSETSGKANSIFYEGDIIGLVDDNSTTNEITVMGQQVAYDGETIFESTDVNINTIAEIPVDAVVEVSGYKIGNNSLYATRIVVLDIQYQTGEEITVKGAVGAPMTSNTFMLGSLTVAFDTSTQYINIPNQKIHVGMEVKVKSVRGFSDSGELHADFIQLNKRTFTSRTDEIEVEGIVTDTNLQFNNFMLNGYKVLYSNQTEFVDGDSNSLINGAKVEVEGSLISDSEVQADEISFRGDSKIDLIARVNAVDVTNNQVQILGATLQLNGKTLIFDNDVTTRIRNFSLKDVNSGDKIKIKAYKDNKTAVIIVKQFRRIKVQSNDAAVELKGELEQVLGDNLVVSGIAVDRSQAVGPVLSTSDIGKVVTVVGTAPSNADHIVADTISIP